MTLDLEYRLDSRYLRGIEEPAGKVFLSGQQALVRLLLAQAAADRAAGINSAGFVSGYRGSPLGGLDQEMVAIAEELPDMAAARLAFFQQYGAEMAAGDRIMRDAETEIAAMKDRIGALRDRLELD